MKDTNQQPLNTPASDIPTPPTPPAPSEDTAPAIKTEDAHIHSLYDDMDAVMHSGQTGTLAQVLKETQEKEAEHKERSLLNPKNLALIGGGVLLLILGVVVLVFALSRDPDTTPERIEEFRIQTIVPSTTQYGIGLDNVSVFSLRESIRSVFLENITPRELQYVYFTTATPTGNRLATTREFFDRLEIELPQSLSRTIDDRFMFGTFRTNEMRAPYLVINFEEFDRAFEGVTSWERTILRDLSEIFNIPREKLTTENFERDFIDRVIQNVPTRILLEESEPSSISESPDENTSIIDTRFIDTDSRNILLVYSFINESTLVITTDPSVINEMRRRIRERQIFNE